MIFPQDHLLTREEAEKTSAATAIAYYNSQLTSLIRQAEREGIAWDPLSTTRSEENERCARICWEQQMYATAKMIRSSLALPPDKEGGKT